MYMYEYAQSFILNYLPIHKMEDDSLSDDCTILVRETPHQTSVTPESFSKKLVCRLGLNRIKRSETILNNNELITNLFIHRLSPLTSDHNIFDSNLLGRTLF